jgi:hypothetical protein
MIKCSTRSVSMLIGIVALVLVGSSFAPATARANQDEKGRVDSLGSLMNATTAEMMTLSGFWNVTECCGWTGLWRRRPNTLIYDASWKHSNGTVVTDVVRMASWNKTTGEVTFTRDGNHGTYRAFLDASKLNLQRGTTSWYPAGLGWSAVAIGYEDDQKGKVVIR